MENQKSKNILEFDEKDIITRVEPAIFYNLNKQYSELFGIKINVATSKDPSYIGTPLKYHGITNEKIHLEFIRGNCKGKKLSLRFEEWQDGWAKYNSPKISNELLNKETLENKLNTIWN